MSDDQRMCWPASAAYPVWCGRDSQILKEVSRHTQSDNWLNSETPIEEVPPPPTTTPKTQNSKPKNPNLKSHATMEL